MTTDELIIDLRSLKDDLQKKYGIEEMALFGSYARGEANEDSDVDIAIMSTKNKNYFTLISAMHYIEEKLQKSVDIGYMDSIRPFVKKRIKDDLIYV